MSVEIEVEGKSYSVSPIVHRFLIDCMRYIDSSVITGTVFGFDDNGTPIVVGGEIDLEYQLLEKVDDLQKQLADVTEQLRLRAEATSKPKPQPAEPTNGKTEKTSTKRGKRTTIKRSALTPIGKVGNRVIYQEALDAIPKKATRPQIVAALIKSNCYAKSTAEVLATAYRQYLRGNGR